MKQQHVLDLIGDELAHASRADRGKLDEIDRWLHNENPVEQHRRQRESEEKRVLADLARTPLLPLVVRDSAQQMILEGVASGEKDTSRMWAPWERNGMPSREFALYEAAVGYGIAYATVLPGVDRSGQGSAVIQPMSPRDLFAVYGDPVVDEWPMYALRTIPQPRSVVHYRLMDEESVHFVAREETGRLVYIEEQRHGVGVTPVVRYANDMDLEGRTPGEVDRFKGLAARYEKTTNDRMLIQHYNSWRIRTATGLEEPGSIEEKERQKALLRHEDILTGSADVTFSSLPETTLDGIIKAGDTDRDTLAAASQTPVWALNGGQLVNLSADALAEARSTSRQKVGAKRRSIGRSHAQALRLAAHIEGRADDAEDFGLRMLWADVESRSMAQAADALGKIAAQLQVPVEKLWDMIPGISKTVADEWREFARSNPTGDDRLAAAIERQYTTQA